MFSLLHIKILNVTSFYELLFTRIFRLLFSSLLLYMTNYKNNRWISPCYLKLLSDSMNFDIWIPLVILYFITLYWFDSYYLYLMLMKNLWVNEVFYPSLFLNFFVTFIQCFYFVLVLYHRNLGECSYKWNLHILNLRRWFSVYNSFIFFSLGVLWDNYIFCFSILKFSHFLYSTLVSSSLPTLST